jgi:hypothetical protein
MTFTSSMSTLLRTRGSQLTAALACALALVCSVPLAGASAGQAPDAASQTGQIEGPPTKPAATAILQQCLTATAASERSATFEGEMNAVPGSAKMEMQIDVLERLPGELGYHMVSAPGLGIWRTATPLSVKSFTLYKQVVNLAAPAFYRGAVRFRWLNAKGRIIRASELRTRRCEQLAPEGGETETPQTTTTQPATTG